MHVKVRSRRYHSLCENIEVRLQENVVCTRGHPNTRMQFWGTAYPEESPGSMSVPRGPGYRHRAEQLSVNRNHRDLQVVSEKHL